MRVIRSVAKEGSLAVLSVLTMLVAPIASAAPDGQAEPLVVEQARTPDERWDVEQRAAAFDRARAEERAAAAVEHAKNVETAKGLLTARADAQKRVDRRGLRFGMGKLMMGGGLTAFLAPMAAGVVGLTPLGLVGGVVFVGGTLVSVFNGTHDGLTTDEWAVRDAELRLMTFVRMVGETEGRSSISAAGIPVGYNLFRDASTTPPATPARAQGPGPGAGVRR